MSSSIEEKMISVHQHLENLLKRQTLPQALLFTGSSADDLEKETFSFAAKVLQQKEPTVHHPDLHVHRPEGKSGMHAIESIRHLCEEVNLVSYQSSWKCFLLLQAERMLPTSSNALLKTLEEPPAKTLFILTAANLEQLLPTIVSRCQVLRFPRSSSKQNDLLDSFLSLLPSQLSFKKIEELAEQLEKEKSALQESTPSPIELTALQQESNRQKSLGKASIHTHEKLFSLLEGLLQWYRDRWCLDLHLSEENLFFPHYASQIAQTPFIPLREVEKILRDILIAVERGMSFSFCLETLCRRLQLPLIYR